VLSEELDVTTWTTEDLKNAIRHDGEEYVGVPFFGWVKLHDEEDREQMLREQLHVLQAECQRLKKKLMDAGIHD
jgi:hypothetical protein